MKTFTVIWRDNGDDYFATKVEIEDDMEGQFEESDFVMMAAEVEYADDEDRVALLDELSEKGYDLIGVIRGEVDWLF